MIKVNLITGFLGSGKTTAIQNLLKNKPINETWAVLINEFGDIGIDSALLADSGVMIKEIAGGYMYCVNDLSMQVGLNKLLKHCQPDRLLIEPNGLAHPEQILTLLTLPEYRNVIDLRATLCLVDARQLQNPRYLHNENFRDQLAVADIIIANKSDSYQSKDYHYLTEWQKGHDTLRPLIVTSQGNFALPILDMPRCNQHMSNVHNPYHETLAELTRSKDNNWRRAINYGEGYVSCGWVFDSESCFTADEVIDWVRNVPGERVKGVVRVSEGTLIINRQGNDLHIETRPVPPMDSRIELIYSEDSTWRHMQTSLLDMRIN